MTAASRTSRRLEIAAHAARVGSATAVLAAGARLDCSPVTAVGSIALLFACFGLGHDLVHGVLGLPRRLGSVLLTLSHLGMLASGHGVQHTHRVHHRAPLSEGDLEGRPAHRTLLGAIVHAPLDAARARLGGFVLARGARRWVVAAENLACVLLAIALGLEVVPGGRVHLSVCLLASLTIGVWATWIPHHAPAWLLAIARPFARTPSLVARSLVHHDLHHARPDVPSAWLAGLAT